ncbi:hypothetical protein [Mangrovibacterium lignilyticum]|uniref:hypothetical protein n=1 Tax=Mangrovibacterium lignilyticum TaxID=2668052 RepID=UPI0013D6609F|nr:hypothetical protein [Mangrovibacterium lignilyticum]
MRSFARQLLGKGKRYDYFLQQLLGFDYFKEDGYLPISLKEIEQTTGLPYTKIRTYLHLIYEDLLEHEKNHLDLSVHKVEYTFSMHYFEQYAELTVNHLCVIPRVGEQVNIPFFRAKVGTTTFFVDSIHHRLTHNKHIVEINLSPGYYNYYWKFRKDEAYEKGEISIHEYYMDNEYELKEKLKLRKW